MSTETDEQEKQSYIPKEVLPPLERWQMPDVANLSADKKVVPKEPKKYEITAEELSAIKKKATDEGFQQGHDAGYQQGQHLVNEHVHRLQSILNQMVMPLSELDESVEQALLQMTVAIAQQVLQLELKMQPESILHLIQEMIKALPINCRQVELICHPDDLNIIKPVLSEQKTLQWSLSTDSQLALGACRLISENSVIEESFEQRLNVVIDSIQPSNSRTSGKQDNLSEQSEERPTG